MPTERVLATAAVLATLAGARPAVLDAQLATVSVAEENFRLEPRGTKLATLLRGAGLRIAGSQGRWREATLEGWIWTPSVSRTDRDGFDLRVSRRGGENLRDAPNGEARRLAVLLEGCLLERLGSEGNWTRVRRTAWVWAESLAEAGAAAAAAGAPPAAGSSEAVPPETETAAGDAARRVVVGADEVRVLSSPDGDTLAIVRPGADLSVLGRQGSWARVRLDGWVWLPATLPADSTAGDRPTAADLRANPDRYVGQRVRWRVKVYSLERAEPIRTDFFEGEPFLLASPPEPSHGLVYLAVPSELMDVAEAIRPLQEVEVLARVRTGRSALMQTPILDLLAIY